MAMIRDMTYEERVLPPEHEQAGARFPSVGEIIEATAFGESADDWSSYEVLGLSPDGRPMVDPGDGSLRTIDDLEWGWPNGGPPETRGEVPCPRE